MGLLDNLRNSAAKLELPDAPTTPEMPSDPLAGSSGTLRDMQHSAWEMKFGQLTEEGERIGSLLADENVRQASLWAIVNDNVTPEVAAQIRALSEETGLPLGDASTDFANGIIKSADISSIRTALSDNQGLYAALIDNALSAPELLADVEGLSVVDLLFKASKLRTQRVLEQDPVDVAGSLASSFTSLAWGQIEGGVEFLAALERRANEKQQQNQNWLVGWMEKAGMDVSEAQAYRPEPVEVAQYLQAATAFVTPHAEALEEWLAPEHRTFTTDVAGAFGSFAALALTFYAAGPVAGTVGMVGVGADQQIQIIEEQRKRLETTDYAPELKAELENLSGLKADGTEYTAEEDWAIITAALTEATIEKIAGVEFILKVLPNKARSALVRILLSAGAEGATEALQSISQKFIASQAYAPDIDITEGAAYEALLGAIVGGGVASIPSGGTGRPRTSKTQRLQAQLDAVNLQLEDLEAVRMAVKETKTFQLDPVAVRDVLEKSGDQVVSLPAEEVGALYQEGFISDADLEALQISDSLQQMAELGSDIEVPASVLLTLPDSDFASLLPHVRLQPDQPTQAEAMRRLDEQDAEVQRLTSEIAAALGTDLEGVDKTIRVREEVKATAPVIKTQIMDSLGMPEAEASAHAAHIAHRYATRAVDMDNVTALQLLEEDQLQFQRGQAPTQPQVMDEAPTMEQQAVADVVRFDNPKGEWLENKIRYAEEDMAAAPANTATAHGITGSVTAYTPQPVMLPVPQLERLEGAMGEHRFRVAGQPKFDQLMERVQEEGFQMDAPILIGINHKGQPYIVEGNHRVAVAAATGVPAIPAEVKWYNGAEQTAKFWTPERVSKWAAPATPTLEQQEAVTTSPEFQAWFGDSKIVDESGAPLLVHHMTFSEGFTAFDFSDESEVGAHFGSEEAATNRIEIKRREEDMFGLGRESLGEPSIGTYYLNIANPLRMPEGRTGGWRAMDIMISIRNGIDGDFGYPRIPIELSEAEIDGIYDGDIEVDGVPWEEAQYDMDGGEAEWMRRFLRSKGYDGIIYTNEFEGGGDSYIIFSPEQVKSTANRGTFDPASPNILEQSAAEFQVNPAPVEGTGPNGKVKKQDLARFWTDRHMSTYGRALDPVNNDGDYEEVLSGMIAEYEEQLSQHDDGLGWYTADIARALEVTQQIIPELAEPAKRDLFMALAAVTSPRERPNPNWEKAIDAMQQYVATGVMPERKQNGKRFGVSSVTSNIQLLGNLIETYGEQGAVDWLTAIHTGAEMAQVRKDSGLFVEGKSLAYYTPSEMNLKSEGLGVYMFGPKVGDFFLNASGVDQNAVTVDMWLAQTYNRHIGRLLDIGKAALDAGGVATEVRTKTERDIIKTLIRDVAARKGVEPSAAQAALWYFEQRLERSHGLISPSQSFSGAAENAATKRGIEVQPRDPAPDGRGVQDAAEGLVLEQYPAQGEVNVTDTQTLYERGIAPSHEGLRSASREERAEGRPDAEIRQADNPVAEADLDRIQDDPEFLKEFLTRPNWGVVTATQALPDDAFHRNQRENAPKLYALSEKRQAERNAEAEAYLRTLLDEQGIPYIEMQGVYKGEPDGTSFMIVADEATVAKFGKQFNQESVLTRDGLIFTTRPQPDVAVTGETKVGEEATQEDFFSVLPSGQEFSMDLDFATTGAGQVVLPKGYTEDASRPQLPIRPDGFVELYHWSGRQLTDVDPAFAGTGPLQGVERKRGAQVSFFGVNPKANRRAQGTGYVKESGLGSQRHVAFVRPEQLYPLFEDPAGLAKGTADIDAAEQAIRDAGYLGYYVTDDGSGAAPNGNVAVLFDKIDVLLAPEMTSPVLEQGPRGAYVAPNLNSRKNLIWLSDQADLSTFLHETGHMFLFQLIQDAQDSRLSKAARPKYKQMLEATRSWFGQNAAQAKKDLSRMRKDLRSRIKAEKDPARTAMLESRLAALDRVADKAKEDKTYLSSAGKAFMAPDMQGHDADAEVLFHELWARGYERYLSEGKAPTKGLRRAFQKFSSWMISVYRQMANLNVELSPEIRDVFDRLLATEEALANESNSPTYKVPSEILQFATATEARKIAQLVDEAELEAKAQMQQRQARLFQQEERDKRSSLRKELTERFEAEVRAEPVYAAERIAREGVMPDGQEIGSKPMDKAEVDALIGKARAEALPAGVATKGTKDGKAIPAGDVAVLAGYDSTEAMLRALTEAHPTEAQAITRRVEEEVNRQLGEETSPAAMAEDAAASAQNDKFAELQDLQVRILKRMAGSEVEKVARRKAETEGAPTVEEDKAAQEEATGRTGPEAALARVKADVQRRVNIGHRRSQSFAKRTVQAIRRGMDPKAINAAADAFVGQLEVSKATPARYRQAADRLTTKIERAVASRQYTEAASMMEQRALLLAVSKRVAEFQSKAQRQIKSYREFTGRTDKKLATGYSLDYVNAIRAALSPFDLARIPDSSFDPEAALKALQATEETLYNQINGLISVWQMRGAGMTGKDRYRNLTVTDFKEVMELADTLKANARSAAGMLAEGRRVRHEKIAEEINRNADNMKAVEKREDGRAKYRGSAWGRWLTGKRQSLVGSMRIVESWSRMADRGRVDGPLTTYLIRPIMDATDRYSKHRAEPQQALLDLVMNRPDLAAQKPIDAPELDGWQFQSKGELIHFVLHMGNDSNKSKLLRGGGKDIFTGKEYVWGAQNEDGTLNDSRARAFLDRMFDEGVLTKEDMDLVQGIWNIFEATKPAAQAAHKRMYGYNFVEVEATQFVTPFGIYEGGYVPAMRDSLVDENAARHEAEQITSDQQNTHMFPTVERGFTKNRVEGAFGPMMLDLASLPAHFDRVMKFSYLAPTVLDAARMVTNKDVAAAINRISPSFAQNALIPWLQTAASQRVTTPPQGNDWFSSAATTLSRRVGLHLMAGNIVNAAEQVTGFAPAITRVGAGNIAKAMGRWRVDGQKARTYVSQRSEAMAQRMLNSTNEAMHTTIDILTEQSHIRKSELFAAKYGYFLQQGVQNIMDPVVWLAAEQKAMKEVYPEIYAKELSISGDEALAAEKADSAVVFYADQVVRETQASMRAVDIANINIGTGSKRLFLKFYQWFSSMGNLQLTEHQLNWNRDNIGWGHKMGRSFYIYLMTFMIPMVASEALRMALSGDFDDLDDPEDVLEVGTELFIGSQLKGLFMMVPYLGQLAQVVYGVTTEEVYDNRLNMGAPVGLVEQGLVGTTRLIMTLADPDTDVDTRNAIRSSLLAFSLITGLPTNWFSKPLSYAAKVHEGEADPEGLADLIQGAITGRDGTE